MFYVVVAPCIHANAGWFKAVFLSLVFPTKRVGTIPERVRVATLIFCGEMQIFNRENGGEGGNDELSNDEIRKKLE